MFRNGRVYTVAESAPWADAVAVTGNTITYVGDEAGAMALAGPRHRVIDLGGTSAHARLRRGPHPSVPRGVPDHRRRPAGADRSRRAGRDREVRKGEPRRPGAWIRLAGRHVRARRARPAPTSTAFCRTGPASSSPSTDTACGPTARPSRSPGSPAKPRTRSRDSATTRATSTATPPATCSKWTPCSASSTPSSRSRRRRWRRFWWGGCRRRPPRASPRSSTPGYRPSATTRAR